MQRDVVFEGYFPRPCSHIGDDIIGNEDLLLTVIVPWDANPDWPDLQLGRKYALVFNRYTRSWLRPILLPSPYDAWPAGVSFDLLGIVSRKTFVIMCFDGTGEEYLTFFVINDNFSSITTTKRLTLTTTVDPHRTSRCIGFFPTLTSSKLLCINTERKCTLYECTNEASEICRITLDDLVSCNFSFMHDDHVYLFCDDHTTGISNRRLYVLLHNKLEHVVDFPNSYLDPPETADEASLPIVWLTKTHVNFLVVAIFFTRSSHVRTAILNIDSKQWTVGNITYNGILNLFMPPVKGSLGGELLVSARHNQGDNGLFSQWSYPPALSVLALRAIHEYMPDMTKHNLAYNAASIDGAMKLVHFMCTEKSSDAFPLPSHR